MHFFIRKSRPLLLITLALGAAPFVAGCDSEKAENSAPPKSSAVAVPETQEIKEPVPATFSDAARWNKSDICPEGSQLSALIRYNYGPGEQNYGFTHYFGRSCNIVIPRTEGETLIPNGPFVWWYENGKRMSSGNFDHGSLATDWSRWEPDGSLASK
jgi:hypothetical protein